VTVLDASAVLALLQDEPGAQVVEDALAGSVLSTVNLAEVAGKLMDAGLPARELRSGLTSAGVRLVELSAEDAVLAGALRGIDGGRGLSLGDRCCLALSLRAEHGVVLTADRAWTELELPVTVRLVR
jgi:PIN domain nuclease of toxin-antitoxin system